MEDLSPTPEPADRDASAAAKECPECGEALVHTNGCVLCGRCGYSPCD